ncbi:hypothetical protein GBAR_LOCUS11907, partial [Geodia barretti]
MVALEGSEFRSLSFLFSLSNITNSAILHLISTTAGQARTELLVEVLDGHLGILLRTVSARGREFSLPLTVSDCIIE